MGLGKSTLRTTPSLASMLGESTTSSIPRSLHEGLVRERDQKHDFDDIYEVMDDIGRGGLCRVYKIKKKTDKVGGSSRPEHVRRRSNFLRGSHRRLLSDSSSTRLGRDNRKRAKSDGIAAEMVREDSFFESPSLLFALKTINLKLVPKEKIDQLKNEVECLKTLDHKNIIKAYETFIPRNSDKLMIVMELCSGGDLFSRIPYSEDDAASVTRQVLSAVAYMHDRGVIHRDIKMENIVFESKHPDSPIKVIDFGLSRKYTPNEDILVERVGTLYSMAPETMKGAYDEKADLWSIGVCTFIMLGGGNKPFEGKTPKEMVARVLVGEFHFDGEIWDTVSDLAKSFIMDLLAPNARLRPTARQAHEHPWIGECSRHGSKEAAVVDEAFRQRVCECIVRFADDGPFRKLALNVIAKRSTSKEIFELRRVFDTFDKNDTGILTCEQFKEALAQSSFADEEAEKIFRSVDMNRNNVINYTEFLAACIEAQGDLEEYRLAEAFDIMDSDDSGYISRENLRKILGEHSNDKYIDQLIAEADFKKDGRISYDEFLQLFSKHRQKRVSEIYPDVAAVDSTEAVLKKHGLLGTIIERIQSVSSLHSMRRNTSVDSLQHSNGAAPARKLSGDSLKRKDGPRSSSTPARKLSDDSLNSTGSGLRAHLPLCRNNLRKYSGDHPRRKNNLTDSPSSSGHKSAKSISSDSLNSKSKENGSPGSSRHNSVPATIQEGNLLSSAR